MAIDQQKQPVESDEQILVGDELRPKNAFFIAVAETEARNKASGLPDPLLIELLDFDPNRSRKPLFVNGAHTDLLLFGLERSYEVAPSGTRVKVSHCGDGETRRPLETDVLDRAHRGSFGDWAPPADVRNHFRHSCTGKGKFRIHKGTLHALAC